MTHRVLILDANQRSALACARSLGGRGLHVICADSKPSTLAGASRYTAESFVYPSPYEAPQDFVEYLLEQIPARGVDVVLPVAEVTTSLLVEHRDEFGDVTLPLPATGAYDLLTDKARLFALAGELGVAAPRTLFVDHPDELSGVLDQVTYPAVLKPHRSRIYEDGRWLAGSVRYAGNAGELQEIVRADPVMSRHPFMIQEYIQGRGQGLFALYNNGRPVIFFTHRRLREKPVTGGVSVLSESAPLNPDLIAPAVRLLDHVGWHGVAMVEFKVTDDGAPYLMEVNTRLWGSLQLAVDAGVDFPWLLYLVTTGQAVPHVPAYRAGVRSRWLLGDLDHLYQVLAGKDHDRSVRRKAGALLAFLKPWERNTRFEVNRLGDLRPFLVELRQYVSAMFH